MYFGNFNLQDVSSETNKTFIMELSNLFERLDPPLVDRQRIEIACKFANNDEYIEVSIPHKINRALDLSIYSDETESTVKLTHANFNFQEYKEDKQRMKDVINLISKIMQTTIEVDTFYKGNKVVRIQPYFLNISGKKEPLQCSYWNIPRLINPFLKVRKIVKRGSFF